ncbi:sigma-54 interaction domain-containing protein [Pelosinus fermentans]|uniref:HTH-type transcriptional regulatory protein TyrR n=1 Tax=Pelosinus fermentans JBW45 TaxID=1192197 RepID=I8TTE2_9FIRM|nr:sigma 54-interacting transcriptional regulator [Pelosinus fermentans]AJQ29626.1 putative sigma54 specific transcriptional regulator with PAS/PAC sensor [Pelosinus fermentans JBW45]
MQEYIIQINFINCPGLGYKIFQITEEHHIDKIAMEVIPNYGMVLQFQCDSPMQVQEFVADLRTLENIQSVTFRSQMPYKEKEHKLRTILNSVSEGVLAIDGQGEISHINQVACKIFNCTPDEVVGLQVEKLLGKNPSILETLQMGHTYRLRERKIQKDGRTIQFLFSSVPVKNDQGEIIGAVSTVQDFHQVKNILLQSDKTRPLITFDDIVYQSPQMARLITVAKTVAKSSSTILLRGESGTGKELFATALHTGSLRCENPFIAINCTALTDTLLESELFGYEEGAFTGAVKGGKKGLFEQADNGTLFLDEIGDISQRLQVQLLRALQEGTIRRVGGSKEIAVDVRIIAATHRNLEELICSGKFREDLYYRLNVIPLIILPLRERNEDIPLLAQHLIRKICTKLNKSEMYLAKESAALLMEQEWPGNVRQLENTLERLINLTDAAEIRPDHLFAWADITAYSHSRKNISRNEQTLQIEIPLEGEWPSLKDIVAGIEKEVIMKVLEKHPSSRLAGQVLGVSNTTILNKIRAYKI